LNWITFSFGYFRPQRFLAITLLGSIAFSTLAIIVCQEHDETPMQLSGLSVSQAFEIVDDEPLDLDLPLIKQLLYRIKKTSPKSRWQYSEYSNELTWDDILQRTEDYRLWVFDRPARLKMVEKHPFSNLLPDAEIKGLYLCHCANLDGRPFLAISRSIPRAIEIDIQIDEPIRVTGFLFERARLPNDPTLSSDQEQNLPVFIVDRLAWFPDQANGDEIPPSHVELARYGVDIGLLDQVRESNTRSLGKQDPEAFFQMLAGVDKMTGPMAGPRIGFSDLQKNSSAQIGKSIRIEGLVRSCTEIHVTDADIKERIGLSHYYQLILFPDLKGGKIVVQDSSGGNLEFKRYPVTICCTELPAGMQPADVERKPVVVDGFFFRFWKFQSEKTDSAGKTGLPSPLIIARSFTPLESQAGRLNLILLVFVIAVSLGIATLVWAFWRSDQKRKSQGESLLDSLPDQIDLSGIRD
jgi:hypothetical protein